MKVRQERGATIRGPARETRDHIQNLNSQEKICLAHSCRKQILKSKLRISALVFVIYLFMRNSKSMIQEKQGSYFGSAGVVLGS